ncbi:hypothetical protein ACGFI9_03820 [Micromonospora sp. NPDC048930]|uniref:hypothetical protein n=1 Tax=Micromonospora sp. NPDC048930 TaxID=3364261 RepID=UPI003722D7B8
MRETQRVDSSSPLPTYHFASDVTGVRHLIVDDSDADCTDWQIEVRQREQAHRRPFERTVVFGDGAQVNLRGHGPARQAWTAAVGWAANSAEIILPDGSRHPVQGFAL